MSQPFFLTFKSCLSVKIVLKRNPAEFPKSHFCCFSSCTLVFFIWDYVGGFPFSYTLSGSLLASAYINIFQIYITSTGSTKQQDRHSETAVFDKCLSQYHKRLLTATLAVNMDLLVWQATTWKKQQLKPFGGKCCYSSRCKCFFLLVKQCKTFAVVGYKCQKAPLRPAKRVPRCTEWKRSASRPYLEVSVDDEAVVHVLQTQDDFSSIETHLLLTEHAMLRQVVVQVAPCKHTHTHKHAHKHTNKAHQWYLALGSIPVDKLYQTFREQLQESIEDPSMTIFSPAPSVLRCIECLIYFAHSGCNITALNGDTGFIVWGWLAGSRETLSRKYLEVRSVEGGRCSAA